MISNLVVISIKAQEGYRPLLYDVCMRCSVATFFDYYKLLLTALYYLRQPYTTSDGYMLLLTAIH